MPLGENNACVSRDATLFLNNTFRPPSYNPTTDIPTTGKCTPAAEGLTRLTPVVLTVHTHEQQQRHEPPTGGVDEEMKCAYTGLA
jgi:hypothetical protein